MVSQGANASLLSGIAPRIRWAAGALLIQRKIIQVAVASVGRTIVGRASWARAGSTQVGCVDRASHA